MTRFLFTALTLLAPFVANARPALDKPNVVIVFVDDSGYGDYSHTGNPTINTPNISRMVSEGLNFPQFYCASPACTASRYGLLTGRNPIRSGLGAWVIGPSDAKYIHPNEVTIAEGLKARGYATGMFGKWHLGTPNAANSMTPNALPLAHGFDQWLGTNVSHDYNPGSDLIRSNPSGTSPVAGYEVVVPNIAAKVPEMEKLTKRYMDGAVDYIAANKDHPFFLYVAPNMPHLAVHVSNEFKGRSPRGAYGDCVEEIDAGIGRIRKALEDAGIAQNTLVIYASDNGPWIRFQNTASDAEYGEARLLIGSALPFRDGKGSTWEGGQRVPGVFWWPGTIPPATVVRQPASTLDVFPTVMALAGQSLPSGRTIDGRDIRPYFNPSAFTGNVSPFVFYYSGFSDNSIGAVRMGPWKLHTKLYSQTGNNYGFTASINSPLLFNVENDPGERINRAAQETSQVTTLKGLLNSFNASVTTEGNFWK